jgi:hypothetical protein
MLARWYLPFWLGHANGSSYQRIVKWVLCASLWPPKILIISKHSYSNRITRRHSSKSKPQNVAQVPGTCSANINLVTFAHTPDLVKLQEASLPRNAYPAYESRLTRALAKLSQFSSALVRLTNISKTLLSTTSVVLGTVLVPRFDIGWHRCQIAVQA